jgi:serine protease
VLRAAAFSQVTVTTSTRSISIPANADRRPAGAAVGSFGPIYISAAGVSDGSLRTVAGTFVGGPVNGEYAYSITVGSAANPAPRKVVVLAGGDIDNDDRICNRGEPCGAYPVLGNGLEVLQPRSAMIENINFSVTPFGGINPTAASVSSRANPGGQGLEKFSPNVYLRSPGFPPLK